MLELNGTTSKKLTAYIERVIAHLGLEDAYIELNIQKTCDADAGGYCNGDEEDIEVEIARYDSQGKLPTEMLYTNIAHELIHAQQLYSGRMINQGISLTTDDNGDMAMINVVIWEGKEVTGLPYAEHPWELDAYGREEEVYNKCK